MLISVFIPEVVDYSVLMIILIVIVCLQLKYFHFHINNLNLIKSRQKRTLLISTIVFSISLLYRTVMNSLKLFYTANTPDDEPSNEIEDLET